ncbi:MAG: fluoride efflux transporter CrcB [Geodermatophilaceae bacterium]|nr:fluoride efflux transporter CrcB [Geodermatophilaceae bacterium]
MTVALVALGAAIGAPLRYLVERAVRARVRSSLPWGTLLVNVAGSLVLGLLVGLLAPPQWQALLGVGLCGALTTYSAFGFDTVVLTESRERLLALLYVVASLVAGLAAALVGLAGGAAIAG